MFHKCMKKIIFFIIGICMISCNNNGVNYFDQEIPLSVPQIFAPGVISLENRIEGNANFSTNGEEFYFNVTDSMNNMSIYWCEYKNKKWGHPSKLEKLGKFDNWEPFISHDSKELLFVSSRPPGNPKYNGRIWKSIRTNNSEWSEPQLLDLGYPTNNGYWYPNLSAINKNILYFGGNIEKLYSKGKGDLYFYDMQQDTIANLETLNSEEEDWDPFISQDESFILWASLREGGFGGTDIYVSFKKNEQWETPINLGEKINSSQYEVAPRISNDGKILFFDRPNKGSQDIYWISSDVIDELRN